MSTDPTGLPDPHPAPTPAPTRAPASGDGIPHRAWVEQIMGMPISVHLRGPGCSGEGTPEVRAAVAAVFAELRAVDARFSPWKPDSELNRLRRGELTLDSCHPDIRAVHALCLRARETTDGWFDAWFPAPDRYRPRTPGPSPGTAHPAPGQSGAGPSVTGTPVVGPPRADLSKAGPPVVGRSGVDRSGADRNFDPTGLVKGWAVQRAARHLAACPGHDHLLIAGGDLTLGCRRTDTPDWRVGVEDPRDRSRLLLSLPLRAGAVATSGSAARGEHIVDPTTGAPAHGLASVTVFGPELVWADVYATAAFARGPDSRPWLAGLPQHAAVLVTEHGQLTTTP